MAEFRDVIDFPGYKVNDVGRVLTSKVCGWLGRVGPWREKATTRHTKTGHLYVNLYRDGKAYHRFVHQLVLEAFVGPRPPGMQCRHHDGNPGNNALDNLAWGTPAQNVADAIRHGTAYCLNPNWGPKCRGETVGTSKLTESQVREIRASDETYAALAKRHGISKSNVKMIRTRRSWAWLK
jgi:hypothetical protein